MIIPACNNALQAVLSQNLPAPDAVCISSERFDRRDVRAISLDSKHRA